MAHIADIIKYEGDNSTFIWKHPCEDFNSLTQLIVHESQEAIFFLNGQALDLFGAGRYTLETQNILESKKQKLVGILLCLYTGLRIGELLALTWDDIDFAAGVLSVTKSCHDGWEKDGYRKIIEPPKTGSSVRLIPVPKQLFGVIKKTKKEVGGIYVVGGGKSISVRSYQRTFELLQKKLHISHRGFHALRHTFATRALECGMDVKTLSEILGHRNPNITLNRYVHSLMEYKHMMMNRLGKLLQ